MEEGVAGLTLSKETVDRATATKEYLEQMMVDRKQAMADRRARRIELARRLAVPGLQPDEKRRIQEEFDLKERELLRETRKRYSPADFECV